MKKYILAILSIAALQSAGAQVIINPQLPPGGLTVKSQLWNLSVVNTTNGPIQAQIELSMTDANNNRPVLTATTRIIDFPKGLKQVRATDVSPVLYNVTGSEYRIDGSAEGFLPIGTFQLCYTVIRVDMEAADRVAEACETVVIEPVSPPQLVTPFDSERVELPRPLFNWLPPSPIQLFTNLTYDFNLVEVNAMQNAAQALQQNMPIHVQGNIPANTLQYPASLPELDTGKLYAWQITAKSGTAEVARSETWTFRVTQPVVETKTSPVYYTRLNRDAQSGYTACYGSLHYAYLNEANDKQIPFTISDITNAAHRTQVLDSTLIDLRFGQNLGTLDFSRANNLKDRHVYLLELVNSKREHYVLKFQYRKTN